MSKVLAGLTAKGADSAELYFQHRRSSLVTMEDGGLARAEADVVQGVGLRLVVDGQTGYAFTDELTLESMLQAAHRAASIPLKDVDITGNGPGTLRRIAMVADDMRFDAGGWTCGKKGQRVPVSQGTPTVLVSALDVGGVTAG